MSKYFKDLKAVFENVDIDDEEIRKICEIREERKSILPEIFESGEDIFQENEKRKNLFMIVEGKVDIFKKVEGQIEHIATFNENEIIGRGAFLNPKEKRYSGTGKAVDKVRLLKWEYSDLLKFIEKEKSIAHKIYKKIALDEFNRNAILSIGKTRKVANPLYDKNSKYKNPLYKEKYLDLHENSYYSSETALAKRNFCNITNIPLSKFSYIVKSLALIKKAAAKTNQRTCLEDQCDLNRRSIKNGMTVCDAIVDACDEIIYDKRPVMIDQFVVDMIQGGAGTSTNMNANEVIANRAQEILGYKKHEAGDEAWIVNPNDHVNLSQSTNDVYPTAIRLAMVIGKGDLKRAMIDLIGEFKLKAVEFGKVEEKDQESYHTAEYIKMSRTQLQDAVPMTLGMEFESFAENIEEDLEKLDYAGRQLREVNLGGTAIGTGTLAEEAYIKDVIPILNEVVETYLTECKSIDSKEYENEYKFYPAKNKVEATWDTGAYILFSGMLKRTVVKLSKICNDLRLLSSGPVTGFGDIKLPKVQAGSSIMPGKVNPVIPEVVNQIAFQVIGNDLTVTMASEAGQLQLNAFEPVIAFNIFQSLHMIMRAFQILAQHVKDIEPNKLRCKKLTDLNPGLATFLSKRITYDEAKKVAEKAEELTRKRLEEIYSDDFHSVKQAVKELKIELSDDELNELLNPEKLIRPYAVTKIKE